MINFYENDAQYWNPSKHPIFGSIKFRECYVLPILVPAELHTDHTYLTHSRDDHSDLEQYRKPMHKAFETQTKTQIYNLKYIDFYEASNSNLGNNILMDGIHFNPKGQDILFNKAKEVFILI